MSTIHAQELLFCVTSFSMCKSCSAESFTTESLFAGNHRGVPSMQDPVKTQNSAVLKSCLIRLRKFQRLPDSIHFQSLIQKIQSVVFWLTVFGDQQTTKTVRFPTLSTSKKQLASVSIIQTVLDLEFKQFGLYQYPKHTPTEHWFVFHNLQIYLKLCIKKM